MGIIINAASIPTEFPFSNEEGAMPGNINRKRLRQIAKAANFNSALKFQHIIDSHQDFLMNGGAGGKWQTILLEGLVVGIYENTFSEVAGQANFERINITKHSFEKLTIPFANFCACFAEEVNFSNSDLSHSLFTDAFLVGTNFAEAYLVNVDFSRADLRGADFRGANLSGADFENCDLSGADFRNTNRQNARFPGANLTNVKY